MDQNTEKKRQELLQFIKTVGAPHIYTMYNFYLKECGCEALIPDGPDGMSEEPSHTHEEIVELTK